MSNGESEKPKSQEKPRDDLKTVQAAAEKFQLVIDSSMACLLEQQNWDPRSISPTEEECNHLWSKRDRFTAYLWALLHADTWPALILEQQEETT